MDIKQSVTKDRF